MATRRRLQQSPSSPSPSTSSRVKRVRWRTGAGSPSLSANNRRASFARVRAAREERSYFYFAGFPLRPLLRRETVKTDIVPGRIWSFVQPLGLGFTRVTVNVRMTVVRLRAGGLLVYGPIAPTGELLALLEELGEPVNVIVLPTNAIEHKACFGPFCRRFPDARVFVVPDTWSFPLNLPLPFLGIRRASVLGGGGGGGDDDGAEEAERREAWRDEFEYETFSASFSDLGPFVEVAFFHKDTKTLLVTDACVYVPRDPISLQLAAVLDDLDDDDPGDGGAAIGAHRDTARVSRARLVAWARTVMQVLYFGPRDLSLRGWESASEPVGFDAIAEKLIVSPVVKELVFKDVPCAVRDWVERLCRWDFERIVSAHFEAPVDARPSTLRKAFAFAYAAANAQDDAGQVVDYDEEDVAPDLATLDSLNEILRFVGAKRTEKRAKIK